MDNFTALKEQLKIRKNIYIYGAQATAFGIASALENIFQCSVKGYVVSAMEGNPNELNGKRVQKIEKLHDRDDDTFFLLAVPLYLQSEIAEFLKKNGFTHFLGIDSDLEYMLMKAYLRDTSPYRFVEDYATDLKDQTSTAFNMDPLMCGIEIYVAKSAFDKQLQVIPNYPAGAITVQAGAELDSRIAVDFQDNEGENISVRNRNYDELTVTYWAWKNRSAAYKGLTHYRRYLDPLKSELKLLTEGRVDVILPVPFVCWPDASVQYGRYNAPETIDAMFMALDEMKPGLGGRAKAILAGPYLYNYNMLIARKNVFDSYCAWAFPILFRVEELLGDFIHGSHPRVCSHLGEILLSIYFTIEQNKLRIMHTKRVWLT